MSVVKLSRFGDLSISTDGSITTTKMGKGGGEGVAIEDLRNTSFCLHGFLLISPISGCERIFETVGDGFILNSHVEVEGFLGFDALRKSHSKTSALNPESPPGEKGKKG